MNLHPVAAKLTFIKTLLFKFLSFIIAISILPMIIFMVSMGEKPDWIADGEHHQKESYAVTVEVPLSLMHHGKTMDDLRKKGEMKIKSYIASIALEQIRSSYAISTSDQVSIDDVEQFLQRILSDLPAESIVTEDLYKDQVSRTAYGLYSIDRTTLDVYLQEVYLNYNKRLLTPQKGQNLTIKRPQRSIS